MSVILKKLNRMTTEVLRGMTDAQLDALAATDPHDMSSFSDRELDQLVNDAATPDLISRVALTRTNP